MLRLSLEPFRFYFQGRVAQPLYSICSSDASSRLIFKLLPAAAPRFEIELKLVRRKGVPEYEDGPLSETRLGQVETCLRERAMRPIMLRPTSDDGRPHVQHHRRRHAPYDARHHSPIDAFLQCVVSRLLWLGTFHAKLAETAKEI